MKKDRVLVMLPESYSVARLLCEYVFNEFAGLAPDLLILRKQRKGFERIIKDFGFGAVYELDEEYYGRVSSAATEVFVKKCLRNPYDLALFPFNNFKANTFLFGSVLAKETRAVNSSHYNHKEMPAVSYRLGDESVCPSTVPWKPILKDVLASKDRIVSTLKSRCDALEFSGERPNTGIVQGFGHDIETYCKYSLGSTLVKGKRVLDLGGGIGYGSYLLSRFAAEVVFADMAGEIVELVKKLWCDDNPNMKAVCASIENLPFEEESFDAIFVMDMIEHVKEPEKALKNVQRLLKKDGILVLSTPEHDLFPYRICPKGRWSEPADELLADAIWPWHIQALGEEKLLPMLKRAELSVVEKSYITYLNGYECASELKKAVEAGDDGAVMGILKKATDWNVRDFGVTNERDPYFSGISYNVIARRAS